MDVDAGEIEFLDEDAEIVLQQMVQIQNNEVAIIKSENQREESEDEDIEKKLPSLLIKKKQPKPSSSQDKKRKKLESDSDYDPQDSDYDPQEDLLIEEKMEQLQRNTKRKRMKNSIPQTPITTAIKVIRTSSKHSTPLNTSYNLTRTTPPVKVYENLSKKLKMRSDPQGDFNIINKVSTKTLKTQNNPENNDTNHNRYNICIPDYEDPLCLPVRMIKMDDYNIKLLNRWNSLCLQHLKDKDQTLHIQDKETAGSKRMVVLRNVMNKKTGQNETTVWGKTSVENVDGQKKAIVYHGILPKYRDKVTLDYNLEESAKKTKNEKTINEIILTKENDVDGEMLVAYSLQDSAASVYKLKKEDDMEDKETTSKENDTKLMNMYEATHCKMCAPCYQVSWRGATKVEQRNIWCAICKRSFVSMYNLLAHMKTHDTADVRKHKDVISKSLAKAMEYHYKCKLCQRVFPNIITLRKHIVVHRGDKPFFCEVGNHMTS